MKINDRSNIQVYSTEFYTISPTSSIEELLLIAQLLLGSFPRRHYLHQRRNTTGIIA